MGFTRMMYPLLKKIAPNAFRSARPALVSQIINAHPVSNPITCKIINAKLNVLQTIIKWRLIKHAYNAQLTA